MDVAQLREAYRKNAYKIELPTDSHIFSALLDPHHLQNKLNWLSSRHRHITYEVRCLWYPNSGEKGVFEIIPPGVWHTGYCERGLEGACMVVFQFGVRPRGTDELGDLCFPNAPLESYLKLQDTVEVSDTFGGIQRLLLLREEVEKQGHARFEQIYVQLQLLMLDLARALPCHGSERQSRGSFTLADFYPQVIEMFMASHYSDPGCSRVQLAELLCVSERQLIRIMDRLYGQTFRELLTEFRMEAAERWRIWRKMSAAENAVAVGFLTTKGFLKAYVQYHGKEYKELT